MSLQLKIYGNEETVRLVGEMVRKKREPHSIVIHGEKGLGKKTLAKYIAAQLMCERQDGVPCGVCKACRMLANGTHPDFTVVKSNANGNYIVDESIRPIVYDAAIKPNESNIKVYVIPDLDMSVNTSVQVQNILLKLIEEPPPHAAVILTARSKEIFLPTVISRVLTLGMVSVKDADSAEFLQSNYPDAAAREISDAVSAGRGNIGRCKEYMDKGQFYSSVFAAREIAKAAAAGSEYEILKAFAQTDGKKSALREAIYLFSEIVRDSCIFRLEGKHSELSVSCDKQSALKLSDSLSAAAGTRLYDLLCDYIGRIDANCNLTLTANSLAGQIAQCCK